ncbi:MAG TPA: hypothetical protein DDY37_07965, partial [Legionella sp.]|nr:hypothetical protein [Legionella sp.]
MRFIKHEALYHVQKKWKDNAGHLSWFQLSALTEAQQAGLALDKGLDLLKGPNRARLQLAETIIERDSLAWVCCDKEELLITDARNEPWYRGTKTYPRGKVWELTDVQQQAVLCTQGTWIHQQLSAMESSEFIAVAQKGHEYIATLARYGLQYSIQDHAIHMDWEGSRYRLQNASAGRWGEGIRHLTFVAGTHAICVLPVQPFIQTHERSQQSAYYRLEQDTGANIPRHVMRKRMRGEDKPLLWQYTGTEQYVVLKMNEKGEPNPQNSAEALYLCYVYLGSNQPDKAWAILDDCDKRLGGLSGTYDEMRYLSWIITALPYPLDDNDADAVILNPPYVACKLKALALLAAFSRQDKRIVFPEPTQDERTVNGQYERHMMDGVKGFYDNVNHDIYALYSQMQAMRREMPVAFTLSDVACKQLLQFYHDHIPAQENEPKAVGAMGYEWVRLHLLTLRQEHAHLEAKALTGTASSYDQQRQHEIEHFIKHHEGIAKVRSDLEYVSVDLSLPFGVNINDSMLSQTSKKCVSQWGAFKDLTATSAQQVAAMKALSLKMTDDEFIAYFNSYLFISNSLQNEHRKQLLNFCSATLMAHRHVPLGKQSSNIPLLCNVLYRVLSAERELPADALGYWSRYKELI